MRYFAYRNIPDDNVPQGYEKLRHLSGRPVRSLVVKEQVFPGQFGSKDIHISHVKNDNVFIVAYTYQPLTDELRQEILKNVPQDVVLPP